MSEARRRGGTQRPAKGAAEASPYYSFPVSSEDADEASGEALDEGGASGGIGVYAESGLHAALKVALAGPEDRFEVPLEGKVVDLVRGSEADEELVEIQTKRLDKIAAKVLALAEGHRVRVVHPRPRGDNHPSTLARDGGACFAAEEP